VPGIAPLATAAAAVLSAEAREVNLADPWAIADGFRVSGRQHRVLRFTHRGETVPVTVEYAAEGFVAHSGGAAMTVKALERDGAQLSGLLGESRLSASVVMDRETLHLFTPGGHWALGYAPPLAHAGADADEGGSLTAPMPGKVIALMVEAGAKVKKGQALLVMEAMKMEHTIAAPADGVVERLPFKVGDQVADGAALVGFASAA
jgi:3-methylcrotonyl-CoA carboxylase alpha subunit